MGVVIYRFANQCPSHGRVYANPVEFGVDFIGANQSVRLLFTGLFVFHSDPGSKEYFAGVSGFIFDNGGFF